MPELRHLRVLLAVADERNFTRAAERLHLAQQAVSKSIAQLEAELGVALLERTTREVRLTAAGSALVRDAEPVVAAADAAFARARDHGRGLAGTLAIGATPPVGPALLRDVTRRLRAAAPDLSVALRQLRPRELADALRDGTVDVVLARTASPAPGVEAVELAPTPAALMVPAEHPLGAPAGPALAAPGEPDSDRGTEPIAPLDRAAPIPLAALDGRRLLVWSAPGTPYTDLLLDLCTQAGATVEPVETAVTGSIELVELAALDAVAIVPEGWPDDGESRCVPLAGDVALPLLALRPAGPPTPAVERLLGLLA